MMFSGRGKPYLFQNDDAPLFWRKLFKGRVEVLSDLNESGTGKKGGNGIVKFYLHATPLATK
jgi:hypothetical protein